MHIWFQQTFYLYVSNTLVHMQMIGAESSTLLAEFDQYIELFQKQVGDLNNRTLCSRVWKVLFSPCVVISPISFQGVHFQFLPPIEVFEVFLISTPATLKHFPKAIASGYMFTRSPTKNEPHRAPVITGSSNKAISWTRYNKSMARTNPGRTARLPV